MKHAGKRLLAVLLSLLLILGCAVPASAAGQSEPFQKDETVYVILNEDGAVQKQIVSDWLHSDTGFHGVVDKNSLSAVENLKSDTEPAYQDGGLKWDTEETDLYYQGESDAGLPVSVKLRYELDGRELPAGELSGKSGHLKITAELTNHETETVKIGGKEREICTPFMTVCCVLLPSDTYQNVTAEHGTVQTDSKTQLACFLTLPGVKASVSDLLPDSLRDVEELLLDGFTVEADVTDCEAPTFLFAASAGTDAFSEELDTEELTAKLEELTDATNQLQDGTAEVDGAVGTLVEKLGELAEGYSQFDAGIGTALSGAGQLAEGGKALLSGANTLSEKSGELAAGTAQLKDGAAELSGQLNTQLVPALTQAQGKKDALQGKMAALSAELNSLSIPDTSGLKSQLSAGVGQVFDGAAQGAAKAAATATGEAVAQQLSGALSSAQQAIPEKSAEAVGAVQSADLQIVQQVLAGSGLDSDTQAALLSAVQNGMGNAAPALSAGVAEGIGSALPGSLLSGNPITEQAAEQIAGAVCGSEQMQAAKAQAVSTVSAAVPDFDTSSLNGLLGEFQALSAEASSMLGQVDTLTAALYDPGNPANEKTVVGAANALAAGAQTLNSGTEALAGGAGSFAAGIVQLTDGADALYAGLNTLSGSSKTVADSISQFQSGGNELKDGTSRLRDGMDEFARQVVEKLTEAVSPDSDLAKVLEEMAHRAKAFEGTGRGENTELTVKYVMRTAPSGTAAEADGKQEPEETKGAPVQEESLWDRIKGLFR